MESFAPPLWENGPRPGSFYPMQPHEPSRYAQEPGRQHTTQPIVTGTSVLAIKFDGGVAIAADTLGSYGSMARFRDISRLMKVGEQTIVGGSGDIADFHAVRDLLNDLSIENDEHNDGIPLKPKAVHSFLTRVMYGRRSRMNPLWNTLLVAGIQDGKPVLGYVDKVGVAFEEDCISTGYGAYIALPILRSTLEKKPNLTKEEAVAELEKCLKVLYYRDGRSLNKFQIATVTAEGSEISEPKSAETNWDIASLVKGYE